MGDYWVPKYRWQLVEWLRPRLRGSAWKKYPKTRLLAIYYRLRGKNDKKGRIKAI